MSEPHADIPADYPQPLVSVVMPVRDQQRVLRQTLDSVCSQTLRNFELVLVDDGSVDGSGAIEQELAAHDPRIRLFLRTALGAASARNFGLGEARGRYVIFLDSDDLFHPDLLLSMAAALEATGADICICEADAFHSEGAMTPFIRFGRRKEGLYPRHALGRQLFRIGAGGVWNKMYRRRFLVAEGILFQNIRTSEDNAFTAAASWRAGQIYLLKRTLVYYRRGLGTSLLDTRHAHPLDGLKAAEKVFEVTHGQHDLQRSELISLRTTCVLLLGLSLESLIAMQAYDESARSRLAACLRHWGPLGMPRTGYELGAVMKAGLVKHATCNKAIWANSRWKQKTRDHTALDKAGYALRIIIAIALSNFPTRRCD